MGWSVVERAGSRKGKTGQWWVVGRYTRVGKREVGYGELGVLFAGCGFSAVHT